MARVASSAMLRTLVMAACLVAAMVFSALRQFRIELIFQRLATCVRLGSLPFARFIGDCLRAGASIGQRLLVGCDGGIGLGFERDASARSSAMCFCRFSMIEPTRGSANFAIST